MSNVKLQVTCWMSTDGRHTIKAFDKYPLFIRHYLRESPFNICVCCLYSRLNCAGLIHDDPEGFHCDNEEKAIEYIKEIEDKIRRAEGRGHEDY